MKARWLAVLGSLMVVTAGGVTACGGEDEGATTAAGPAGGEAPIDLTVGDIVPLTGDLADFGPPGRKAADLATEQIEDAIDKAGVDHRVSIEHEDEQTDPQAAVEAARTLTGEGANCLTGAWASADTIPVARSVTTREGVLQISPASTSDEITGLEDDGLVNRTVPPDSLQGPALADAIEDQIGGAEGKTVNIGARNDAYGTGLAEAFRGAWEEKGGTIGQEVVYDPEQPSYNSEAAQLTEGDPDAYAIFDFPETYGKVGPALVRTGDFDASKAFATDGLASSDLPKDAGREATEGMRGTAPGAPEEGAASEAFDRLYSDAPGPERQTFDAQNFDAVILCYLAAVAAGSTDGADMAAQVQAVSGPPGTKYSWEELDEAIEALQNGEDIDYEGAAGEINLNEAGDATSGVYDIYEYRNGALDSPIDQVPIGEDAQESDGQQ